MKTSVKLAKDSFSSEILAHKVRRHIVEMTHLGKSSHVASCLSIADILAVLYARIIKLDPQNPRATFRDRFILSKGHAGAAVYATLAEKGFFPTEMLKQHYQNGSIFSGHVSHKGVPGVELSTGSLGHGLGVGAGMALAGKRSGQEYRTFVLMSDGECDEGSVWEASMFASHHNLTNLVAIIDYNKLQSLTTTTETLDLEPFARKWQSFGWNVFECDGHKHDKIYKVLKQAYTGASKPTVIICHTVKGKGVSFMENSVLWHYRSPQGEEYRAALEEIDSKVKGKRL